jgi:hypothetical protein
MESKESTEGKSENNSGQNNQSNPSMNTEFETNFLEFGKPKRGKHTLAIIKEPNQSRGKVAAEIFINYEGEPKRATYVAKDRKGNILFPPTEKLWQLKQAIKENTLLLHEKLQRGNSTPKKEQRKGKEQTNGKEESVIKTEAKEFSAGIINEAHGFASSAKNIIHGTEGRQSEIKVIRQRKSQRNRDINLSR